MKSFKRQVFVILHSPCCFMFQLCARIIKKHVRLRYVLLRRGSRGSAPPNPHPVQFFRKRIFCKTELKKSMPRAFDQIKIATPAVNQM